MVEPTEIEKHSLEAHVELCAERYNGLIVQLTNLDTKINSVSAMVKEVKECVTKLTEKNTDRLINWGVGIIGFLGASVLYLIAHYVFK